MTSLLLINFFMALSAFTLEDLGVGTPEGPNRIVSQGDFAHIDDVSNNERQRVSDLLKNSNTEDDSAIRALYGIE